jgi:hypothetical protein
MNKPATIGKIRFIILFISYRSRLLKPDVSLLSAGTAAGFTIGELGLGDEVLAGVFAMVFEVCNGVGPVLGPTC